MLIQLRATMRDTAGIFKALSDETRLRVMKLLGVRELCVCELMQVLNMSQPRISRHLGVLKNAGLVNDHREGKWVFYSLPNGIESPEVRTVLQSLSSLANKDPLVIKDNKNLKLAVRLSEIEGKCSRCASR